MGNLNIFCIFFVYLVGSNVIILIRYKIIDRFHYLLRRIPMFALLIKPVSNFIHFILRLRCIIFHNDVDSKEVDKTHNQCNRCKNVFEVDPYE